MTSSATQRLGQLIYDKCARTGDLGSHPPCVVLIPHPLLSGAAIAREMATRTEHLFVQSAGTSRGGPLPSLCDALFEHLLCQAGLLKLHQESGSGTDSDMTAHYLSLAPVAVQRALEMTTTRTEQLAARAAITDSGMQVSTAHNYLALCTRNAYALSREVRAIQTEFAAQHLDSRQPGEDYTREHYDENYGVESSVTTNIKMKLDPRFAAHQGSLAQARSWHVNRHTPAPDLPQVEVLVGDWCLDEALLECCCAPGERRTPTAPALGAIQRTEALVRTRLYDHRNTLYVVLSPSTDYTRIALASVQQWMANNYADLGLDLRCDIAVRLAAAVASTWDRALALLSATTTDDRHHVLTVQMNGNPAVADRVQAAPSRYFSVANEAVATTEACVESLVDLLERTQYAVGTQSPEEVVHGTKAQLMSSVLVESPTRKRVTLCAPIAMSVAVEDIGAAFKRLFGVPYYESEFHVHIEARSAPEPHAGYDEIPDGGSALLKEADDGGLMSGVY